MLTQSFARLQQAYRQAPWQRLRQWWGLLLLGGAALVLLAVLHLALVSRTAIVGREIELLRAEVNTARRQNIQLAAQYAELTAYDVMYARALALGYRKVPPEEQWYVYVDGYSPPEASLSPAAAPAPASTTPSVAYTQSLLDWVLGYLQEGRR